MSENPLNSILNSKNPKIQKMLHDEIENMNSEAQSGVKGHRAWAYDPNASKEEEYIYVGNESTFPKWYRQAGVKNKTHLANVIDKKRGPVYDRLKLIAHDRLVNGYTDENHGYDDPNEEYLTHVFNEGHITPEEYNQSMGRLYPNFNTEDDFDFPVEKNEKSDLKKGSLQSRIKYNPRKGNEAIPQSFWVHGSGSQEDRQGIPRIEGNARIRALHKLSGMTHTKINPETGKRQFLLHRGIGTSEQKKYVDLDNNQTLHHTSKDLKFSSWTPDHSVAFNFSNDPSGNRVISAYIDEDDIHSIPLQTGVEFKGVKEPLSRRLKNEKEIIIHHTKPHELLDKNTAFKLSLPFSNYKHSRGETKRNVLASDGYYDEMEMATPHKKINEKAFNKSENALNKADPYETEKEIWRAMDNKDYDTVLKLAPRIPRNWDIYQQFPSHHELPDHFISKLLDQAPKDSSFGFELAHNLPDDVNPETLEKFGKKYGENDHFVKKAVTNHPNFKPSKDFASLQRAGNFWADYESGVKPYHFATVKSMFTGKPEKWTSFRGDGEGTSEHTQEWIPDLQAHAQKVREHILKDNSIPKKYIDGEPHVKVFRGVGGNYGKAIHEAAGFDPESNTVKSKTLKIPTAPLSSWSINKDISSRFAHGRGSIDKLNFDDPDSKYGAVIEKWMPVKDIIHSGFHSTTFNQEHPHSDEDELVFGHTEPNIKFHTKDIHFQRPHHDYGVVEKAKVNRVPRSPKMGKNELKKGLKHAIAGLGLMAGLSSPANLDSQKEDPQSFEQQKVSKYGEFGKKPEDKFLHNIMQVETSGGKNFDHPLITSGPHKGYKAIGRFALMPLTIQEFAKRHLKSGGSNSEISKLANVNPHSIGKYLSKKPELELEFARALARHVLKKFGGENPNAAYAWKYGHNKKLASIDPNKRDSDIYIKKFKQLNQGRSIQGLTPAIAKNEKTDLIKAPYIMDDVVSDALGQGLYVPPVHSSFKHVRTNKLKNGLYHHVAEKGSLISHHLSTSSDPRNDLAHVAYLSGDKRYGGMQVGFAKVRKNEAGKGYGKLLYLSALAHHGELDSDTNLTHRSQSVWENLPKVGNGLVQVKLSNQTRDNANPDATTFHTAKADQEGLKNMLFEKTIMPKKLAAAEYMANNLKKGSLQSRLKYNPTKDVGVDEAHSIMMWQKNRGPRFLIPRQNENARQRSLNKLSKLTEVRRDPETGKRLFLLHRGMSQEEMANSLLENKHVSEGMSSWTPRASVAQDFATKYQDPEFKNKKSPVSAWIHEDDIHHYLPEAGDTGDKANFGGKIAYPNSLLSEHEVIVRPTREYHLASNTVSKKNKLDQTINTRFNRRVDKSKAKAKNLSPNISKEKLHEESIREPRLGQKIKRANPYSWTSSDTENESYKK